MVCGLDPIFMHQVCFFSPAPSRVYFFFLDVHTLAFFLLFDAKRQIFILRGIYTHSQRD